MTSFVYGGVLDPSRAEQIRAHLEQDLGSDRPMLHVDLRPATKVHCSVVAALVAAARRARRNGGSLTVSLPANAEAARTFELTGLLADTPRGLG